MSSTSFSSSKCNFSHVRESSELSSLVLVLLDDASPAELLLSSALRLRFIIEKYQEQPNLLHPHLGELMDALISIIKTHRCEIESALKDGKATLSKTPCVVKVAFSLVYTLCKVCGYKVIVRYLPHSVEDLGSTFTLLQYHTRDNADVRWSEVYAAECPSTPGDDGRHGAMGACTPDTFIVARWEAAYVLYLWLSIAVLIPFSLETLRKKYHVAAMDDDGKPTMGLLHHHDDDDDDASGATKGAIGVGEPPSLLIDALIRLGKTHLALHSKARDGAAECLARLLTRPERAIASRRIEFFRWACDTLAMEANDGGVSAVSRRAGVLHALAIMLKVGKREELQSQVAILFPTAVNMLGGPLQQRKMAMKMIQRIALCSLCPRVPSWRYAVRPRMLLQTSTDHGEDVNSSPTEKLVGDDDDDDDDDDDESFDVSDEVEEAVGVLLDGLKDEVTIVRWSCAKGIGRITERLPRDFADDVVQAVLDLFSALFGEAAWHGACLAVAELTRRGLLIPGGGQLERAVSHVEKALQYDVRQGRRSVGANVRDAASYVAWAFARVYHARVIGPHARRLEKALLLAALFDREVNCRRAAAAAFQEGVGRHGCFSQGIRVIQVVDFFSVGSRPRAYTQLSVQVAALDVAYRMAIIEHLVCTRVSHWDRSVRELCGVALKALVPQDPAHFKRIVIPGLVPRAVSKDLNERHGAIVALAEVLEGLLGVDQSAPGGIEQASDGLAKETLNDGDGEDAHWGIHVVGVVERVEEERLYRGRGGEMIRQAVCQLIEAISHCGISLSRPEKPSKASTTEEDRKDATKVRSIAEMRRRRGKPQRTRRAILMGVVDDNLKHPIEAVQSAAARASSAFHLSYHADASPTFRGKLLNHYLSLCSPPRNGSSEGRVKQRGTASSVGRQGYLLALGGLPMSVLGVAPKDVVHSLIRGMGCIDPSKEVAEWGDRDGRADAETRRNAAIGLAHWCRTMCGTSTTTPSELLLLAGRAFLWGQEDYLVDKRGDVGSWVRKESLAGLECLVEMLSQRSQDASVPRMEEARVCCELYERFLGMLLRHSTEKLDTIREVAGETLVRMLRLEIPMVDEEEANESSYAHLRETVRYVQSVVERSMESGEEMVSKTVMQDGVDEQDDDGDDGNINWAAAQESFPRLLPLLKCDRYRKEMLTGLACSIGGGSAALSRDATDLLAAFVNDAKDAYEMDASTPPTSSWCVACEDNALLDRIARGFVDVFRAHRFDDRVVLPLLRTLGVLLDKGCFDSLHPPAHAFAPYVLSFIRDQIRRTGSAPKLLACVLPLCCLATFKEPARTRALQPLMVFLGSSIPKLRSYTAEKLYVFLLAQEEAILPSSHKEGTYDKLSALLCETNWNGALESLIPLRDEIARSLELKGAPERIAKPPPSVPTPKAHGEYKDLVRDAGY